MGIEPTSSAWKAEVLPLNYTRALAPETRMRGPPMTLHRRTEKLVEGVGFEPTKA
jgi:hypothetical protein